MKIDLNYTVASLERCYTPMAFTNVMAACKSQGIRTVRELRDCWEGSLYQTPRGTQKSNWPHMGAESIRQTRELFANSIIEDSRIDTPPTAPTLQTVSPTWLVREAKLELCAAISQSIDKDDQIIMNHVRKAAVLLQAIDTSGV